MDTEGWRDVVGFEGIYEVSNFGRVRTHINKTTESIRHGTRHWKQRILKQKKYPNNRGRIDARVTLYKNKKQYTFLVSRLVAMAWVDGYQEGLTVNHIDGNPLNNYANNLEWVSVKRNIQLGFATGLFAKNPKPCVLMDSDGNKMEFPSLSSASRMLGHSNSYVSDKAHENRHLKLISKDGKEYSLIEMSS